MSKKKMRAFAGAMAIVLAFVPFLSSCSMDEAADNPEAQQELSADEQSRNEAEGSIGQSENELVQYGQVMGLDGTQATVVVGKLGEAADGSGSQTFNAGQDEVVFDIADVSIVDESGAAVEGRTLSADDIVVMRGTGAGSDFKPASVEIIDVAGAGTNADDARIPQDIK